MNDGDWYLSSDGEEFNTGPFDTREEAIDSAPDEFGDLRPGDTFWVGRAVRAASPVSAKNFIQMLDDYAMDVAPDGVDGWDVPEAAKQELDQFLAGWAGRHGVAPKWWDIVEETQHTMPEPTESSERS